VPAVFTPFSLLGVDSIDDKTIYLFQNIALFDRGCANHPGNSRSASRSKPRRQAGQRPRRSTKVTHPSAAQAAEALKQQAHGQVHGSWSWTRADCALCTGTWELNQTHRTQKNERGSVAWDQTHHDRRSLFSDRRTHLPPSLRLLASPLLSYLTQISNSQWPAPPSRHRRRRSRRRDDLECITILKTNTPASRSLASEPPRGPFCDLLFSCGGPDFFRFLTHSSPTWDAATLSASLKNHAALHPKTLQTDVQLSKTRQPASPSSTLAGSSLCLASRQLQTSRLDACLLLLLRLLLAHRRRSSDPDRPDPLLTKPHRSGLLVSSTGCLDRPHPRKNTG
jgi:hypothetical protein